MAGRPANFLIINSNAITVAPFAAVKLRHSYNLMYDNRRYEA
jgi:hypothetical protein